MRKRTWVILWFIGVTVVIAVAATAVALWVNRSGRGADRLVGSWEGQGDARTGIEGKIGEEEVNISLAPADFGEGNVSEGRDAGVVIHR